MPCYGAIQRHTVVSLLRLFDQFKGTGVKAQFHTDPVTSGDACQECGDLWITPQ